MNNQTSEEGLVRELIHHVQSLRKSAGLEVADRIVLSVRSDGAVEAAVRANRDRVAREVLAVDVVDRPLEQPDGADDVVLDGFKVRLELRRAGATTD